MNSGELNDAQVEAAAVESPAEEIRETNSATEEKPSASEAADAFSVPDDNGSLGATAPVETNTALLQSLAEQVETLARSIAEANHLAQERERIIDRLHQENQQLRQGELQQAIMPLFRDLIRLYDDLQQTARNYGSRAEITSPQAMRDFECFGEMVTDILYRQGVERYEAREGEPFNPKEHRVLEAVPTEEETKDRTLARSIRDGFRNETRIIRLVEAEVYRYRPSAPAAASVEEAGNEQAENVQ